MFCLFLDIYIYMHLWQVYKFGEADRNFVIKSLNSSGCRIVLYYLQSQWIRGGGGGGGIPNIKGLLHLLQVEILIYVHSY